MLDEVLHLSLFLICWEELKTLGFSEIDVFEFITNTVSFRYRFRPPAVPFSSSAERQCLESILKRDETYISVGHFVVMSEDSLIHTHATTNYDIIYIPILFS